jgi:hypothetical protein
MEIKGILYMKKGLKITVGRGKGKRFSTLRFSKIISHHMMMKK